MAEVKKVIIPAAGLGTRFFPLSKVLAKELMPLADRPLIDYAVAEAKESGISQVIFVLSENKKLIYNYFKKNQRLENILKKNGRKKEYLNVLEEREKELEGLSFSFCLQPLPKGEGDAILKARNYIKKQPFAVMFPDDVFVSKKAVLGQLEKIFQTSGKPVIGLKKVSPERVSSYGIVDVEKIANRLYKIKGIKEKPAPDKAPSDLAVVGRYILSQEIFPYLKKTPLNKNKEIILAEAVNLMLKDGKAVYGYEIEGDWMECGNKTDWLKSNLSFSLRHPKYGPGLKKFIKKEMKGF